MATCCSNNDIAQTSKANVLLRWESITLLHNQLAAHHVQAANKSEFSSVSWRKGHHHRLVQGQSASDVEVRQHNLLCTGSVCRSQEGHTRRHAAPQPLGLWADNPLC